MFCIDLLFKNHFHHGIFILIWIVKYYVEIKCYFLNVLNYSLNFAPKVSCSILTLVPKVKDSFKPLGSGGPGADSVLTMH